MTLSGTGYAVTYVPTSDDTYSGTNECSQCEKQVEFDKRQGEYVLLDDDA